MFGTFAGDVIALDDDLVNQYPSDATGATYSAAQNATAVTNAQGQPVTLSQSQLQNLAATEAQTSIAGSKAPTYGLAAQESAHGSSCPSPSKSKLMEIGGQGGQPGGWIQ